VHRDGGGLRCHVSGEHNICHGGGGPNKKGEETLATRFFPLEGKAIHFCPANFKKEPGISHGCRRKSYFPHRLRKGGRGKVSIRQVLSLAGGGRKWGERTIGMVPGKERTAGVGTFTGSRQKKRWSYANKVYARTRSFRWSE